MVRNRRTVAAVGMLWIGVGSTVLAGPSTSRPTPGARTLSPASAVVLDTHLKWRSRHWAGRHNTWAVSQDLERGHPRFTVDQPNKSHVWTYDLHLPIPVDRYPILVLTYRAERVRSGPGYVLWLDDGRGPAGGGFVAVQPRDLVDDGRVHQVRRDMRTLKPKGDIVGMALGAPAGSKTPGILELVGLRFEAPPGAPAHGTPPDDLPVHVRVVDPDGGPLAGATVTVDVERTNFARRARSNAAGLAVVTPVANACGKHQLRVEAPRLTPIEIAMPALPRALVPRDGVHRITASWVPVSRERR